MSESVMSRVRKALEVPDSLVGAKAAVVCTADAATLLEAIDAAYSILCSGKPPHSPRETRARRLLRLVGAVRKP